MRLGAPQVWAKHPPVLAVMSGSELDGEEKPLSRVMGVRTVEEAQTSKITEVGDH